MNQALDHSDTIAAIATAAGPAAVGIVRISGSRSAELVKTLTGLDLRERPRRLVLATVRDERGEPIDQVLAVFMPGPNSFTGEDVAELQGHGGSQAVRLLLAAATNAGARLAEAGEFSRRAFENGRLDLTQAEGILTLISAGSERGARVGQALLAGELRASIEDIREVTNGVLAGCEAEIDFPEDVETASRVTELTALLSKLSHLEDTSGLGQALREGVLVALVGETNAGKSSLFNALVGKERALVAAEPGTTRDFVEVTLEWQGVPVTLIDTAGEREASGVESRGIELGRQRAAESDLELVVVPAGSQAPEIDSSRQLLIWSKSDLASPGPDGLATSAIDKSGFEQVRVAVLERLGARGAQEGVLLVSARQQALVASARVAATRALEAAKAGRPPELMAADLRLVQRHLAELVGEQVSDEMLDALFAQFCIGK